MVTGSHIYTTGYIAGGVTYNDLAVLRLDLAGNLVENITWKGNATDIGNGIYITQNEIYVAGQPQTNTTQPTDALIIKYKLPTLGPTQVTGQGQNHITPIATTFIIFAILPIVLVTVSYKKTPKTKNIAKQTQHYSKQITNFFFMTYISEELFYWLNESFG